MVLDAQMAIPLALPFGLHSTMLLLSIILSKTSAVQTGAWSGMRHLTEALGRGLIQSLTPFSGSLTGYIAMTSKIRCRSRPMAVCCLCPSTWHFLVAHKLVRFKFRWGRVDAESCSEELGNRLPNAEKPCSHAFDTFLAWDFRKEKW